MAPLGGARPPAQAAEDALAARRLALLAATAAVLGDGHPGRDVAMLVDGGGAEICHDQRFLLRGDGLPGPSTHLRRLLPCIRPLNTLGRTLTRAWPNIRWRSDGYLASHLRRIGDWSGRRPWSGRRCPSWCGE